MNISSLLKRILFLIGYCPSDLVEKAEADMIYDALNDLRSEFVKIVYEKDETKKVSSCAAFPKVINMSRVSYH